VGNETIDEVLAAFERDGYTDQLIPQADAVVRSRATGAVVPAGVLAVDAYHRLEGASDPEEEVLVAAVRLPDGTRGTLVLSYGPLAAIEDADVAASLQLG
jgi:hypothetical protein